MANSNDIALCTVCTVDHLHGALALLRSAHRHWRRAPAASYVLVVDLEVDAAAGSSGDAVRQLLERVTGAALAEFVDQVPGVVFLGPADIEVQDWTSQAVRLKPHDLCASFRPRVLRRALADGHAMAVYSDNDIWFFDDIAPLTEPLRRHAIVATPHMLTPFPPDTAMLRPTLVQVGTAGVLNSGLFALRNDDTAKKFLDTLEAIYDGPGAFRTDTGSGADQQVFNWVIAFAENVHVARDPRLNVAYWNLHERPIAYQPGAQGGRCTLRGESIVCFHFSGLDWDSERLSRHDDRHAVALNPNLAELASDYRRELIACGAGVFRAHRYAFSEVAGVQLDDAIRHAVNCLSPPPRSGDTRWSENAALDCLAQLYARCGARLALPLHLEALVLSRPDLLALASNGSLYAGSLLSWLEQGLRIDHPSLGALHDLLAPAAYPRAVAEALLASLLGADVPIGDQELEHLCSARHRLPGATAVSWQVLPGTTRLPAHSATHCLRAIYDSRPDLVAAFPDPLGRQRDAFFQWMRESLPREYVMPARVAEAIRQLDPEAALARVLCFLRRRDAQRAALRSGVPLQRLLPDLLPLAYAEQEFGLEDLLLVDWLCGSTLDTVARTVAAVLVERAAGAAAYCDAVGKPAHAPGQISALQRWLQLREARLAAGHAAAPLPVPPLEQIAAQEAQVIERREAVNLIGYDRSPNGLGSLTHGLAEVLRLSGCPVANVTLGCSIMDRTLAVHDLVPVIDHGAPRNIVVGFPHIDYDVLDTLPRFVAEGRSNIAYLAWEQENFHPHWVTRFARFDRLAALSSFAAAAIARGTGREVWVWPACVRAPQVADKASCRARFRFAPDDYVVGFVADAASGVERKNPLAFVRAATAAFKGDARVVLVLKLTQGDIPLHAAMLAHLRESLAASGLRHRIITERVPREEIDALMNAFDVYLSLHRAEGFGYTIAEAMLLDVPVVATGYSGNMDFMNTDNALPVAWQYTTIERGEGPFQPGTRWAEPEIDDAVAKLRRLRAGKIDVAALCAKARADVQAWCSPAAVAERVRRDLGLLPVLNAAPRLVRDSGRAVGGG